MKKVLFGLTAVSGVVFASLALAQMAGGMPGAETHRYGAMGGYLWLWGLYGVVKAGVVLYGLWLLVRLTRAVEKLAASKS